MKVKSTKKFSLLCLAAAAAGMCFAAPVCAEPTAAKNVILVIGDGMQLQHEMAASNYAFGNYSGMSWMKFPRRDVSTWDVTTYNRYAAAAGLQPYQPDLFNPLVGYDPSKGGKQTYPLDLSGTDSYFMTKLPAPGISANFPATDSASAGTAIATGRKTDDGNVAWHPGDPTDGAITTIAEEIRKKKGRAIGVVTTVPFSHATPAVFVSHNVSRDNYYTGRKGYTGLGIADEIIKVTKPEVVIGGGHNLLDNPNWDTNKGYISKDLYENLKNSSDYVLAERKPGVDGSQTLAAAADEAIAKGRKLFGLYGGPGGNFERLVPTDTPEAPSVSRGSIENPTLADSVKAALKVLSNDPDGFFLMAEQGDIDWANHADDYRWMVGSMIDLDQTVKAVVDYVDQPGDNIDWTNTLLIVTSDHGNSYMRLNPEKKLAKGDLPTQVPDASGRYLYAGAYPDGDVKYGSGSHTNELTSLYAYGAGSDLFSKVEGNWYPGTSIIDNTHIYKVMKKAAIGDNN